MIYLWARCFDPVTFLIRSGFGGDALPIIPLRYNIAPDHQVLPIYIRFYRFTAAVKYINIDKTTLSAIEGGFILLPTACQII